ncbi:MAG: hypothetical protein AVDCRST_MAG89-1122 [uncultured Gemmatimonadetes bacterium]|uniref:Uncharacterized protein n=1 Tax=uncultured Gemmatimonadota bacterium TaxID=203437 RepID=A0A6J4KQZ8_9BACT|nr:MAG: hypothetical protein AVDCRST_MAG89-1122 [uncultured Gemmatimonadota bacterium]
MADRLGEQELRDIDNYLAGEATADEHQVKGWLRRLRQQAASGAEAGPTGTHPDEGPLKMHGDALLDGSGTRHGGHEID